MVESKGVKLERALREKEVSLLARSLPLISGWRLSLSIPAQDMDEDDHLMAEWFEMVQQKTKLLRQESELVYELRDLELIEQHDQLEAEIRRRLAEDSKCNQGSLTLGLASLYCRACRLSM